MTAQAKTGKTTEEILAAWNEPGAAGFYNWLEDVKPHILKANNHYSPVELEEWQREIIDGTLQADPEGRFLCNLALAVTPRRHGKTNIFGLVVLWLFTSRRNWTFQVLGNTESHTDRVQMRTVRRIIRNTPALRRMVKAENMQRKEIRLPEMGNIIQAAAGTVANAFGDKVNVLWVGDFHACPDLAPFDAFQASLLDSEDTLCLIDANTDGEGGHVHRLEQEAEEDDKIFCRRIEYRDFEHYLEAAPKWINREKAKRLQRTQLPAAFERDILGKRGAALNSLFKPDDIQACRTAYAVPLAQAEAAKLFSGRKFIVGGGLDRAYGFSLHGDATIWTVVAKVAGFDGEPHYWVLNQKNISFSSGRGIKKAISEDNERYELENVVIEAYNAQDIASWAQESKIPVEVVHATTTAQVPAFTELHRIVAEGRLHFATDLERLAAEMKTFIYDTTGKQPKFGHAKGFNDDRVYSLSWAIWSLRESELATYELRSIVCRSSSSHAKLCYLRAGEMLLPCSETCEAHKRVEGMYLQYRRRKVDSELSMPAFFKSKVRLSGVKVYQNA